MFLGRDAPDACTRVNKYLRPLIRFYRLQMAYESSRLMEGYTGGADPTWMINLILPSLDAESAWSAVGGRTRVLVMASTALFKHSGLSSLARNEQLYTITLYDRTELLPC